MRHAFSSSRVAGGRTLVGGAYGEGSYTSGPWLVTGGVRVDEWASMSGHLIETSLVSGAATNVQHYEDRSGTVFSGRLGAKRDLGDGLYLRAAGYSGFRAPTLNELYRPFRVGNNTTQANANLTPERLYGAEAAVGAQHGRFSWEATGFYNRLQDPVTNVTISSTPTSITFQRRNAGVINAYGAEAEVAYAVTGWARLRGAAGYTHARVDGQDQAPQLTGKRPAQAPEWTASAGLDLTPVKPLLLHADLRYEGDRFDDDQNTLRLAPFARVDLRADWTLAHGAGVFIAVDNLFDAGIQTQRTADNIVSYDAPRTVSFGLTFRR